MRVPTGLLSSGGFRGRRGGVRGRGGVGGRGGLLGLGASLVPRGDLGTTLLTATPGERFATT